MNKEQLKGKLNDAKGRTERQAGEWAGDQQAQGKGVKNQVKGKLQKAAGKLKKAS